MLTDNTDNLPLAKRELSLTSLFQEGLLGGAILADRAGRSVRLTPEAAELLGLEAHAKTDLSLETLPAPLGKVIGELLTAGRFLGAHEMALQLHPRGQVNLRLTALPLPGDKDAVMLLLLNDLTAAKQLEENLLRLHRLASLGTLSAGLAHEIKNALVSSRTFVDLLLEQRPEAELGDVVRREIGRIEALLSRMLRFAAPAKPLLSPISLHKVLDHSLRLVGRQLKEKAIALERDFAAATDSVDGDEYQLEQVFVNLFLNAVDAMGPHGMLTVSSAIQDATVRIPKAQRESYLRITVNDTGTGISKAHLKRLFEPFFTTKEGSTGLGLSVTRRIVEEHQGWITVDSQPGEGTTFQVHLPVRNLGEQESIKYKG